MRASYGVQEFYQAGWMGLYVISERLRTKMRDSYLKSVAMTCAEGYASAKRDYQLKDLGLNVQFGVNLRTHFDGPYSLAKLALVLNLNMRYSCFLPVPVPISRTFCGFSGIGARCN